MQRHILSLEDFLREFQETFPFAQTDILDKWNVSSFNAETFNHYIDREQLAVPGILSARTTAKLIVYCLRIMEAEHEILQAGWVRSLRRVGTDAQDLVNSLGARGARVDTAKAGKRDWTIACNFAQPCATPWSGRALTMQRFIVGAFRRRKRRKGTQRLEVSIGAGCLGGCCPGMRGTM